jgi:hypothetical protein
MEVFGWIVGLVIAALIAAPFAASAIRRARRRHRRRLVNSPRKISIVRDSDAAMIGCRDKGHVRDGRKVRHDGNGGYISVCKRCGVKVARDRGGTWHAAAEEEDAAA